MIPAPVQLAVILCWGGVVVVAFALMWSTGNIVQPMDGVSRLEGLAWTGLLVAVLLLLAFAARAIAAGRRWGWLASAAMAILGALAGALLTVPFAMELVATAVGPVYGMPMLLGILWPAPLFCGACVALLLALRKPECRGWFTRPTSPGTRAG